MEEEEDGDVLKKEFELRSNYWYIHTQMQCICNVCFSFQFSKESITFI